MTTFDDLRREEAAEHAGIRVRISELEEGQSRFMNDLFQIVNDSSDRIRVLTEKVAYLEGLCAGLMSRIHNDPRTTWAYPSDSPATSATGDNGRPKENLGGGGSSTDTRGAGQGN
jgi:hypothetical protein